MAKYSVSDIKTAAHGSWSAVVERVAGIGDDYLTEDHGPCPKCGGSDRWRVFNDFDFTGGAVCNQCGKFADGIAVIQWFTGRGFLPTVEAIGDFLGIFPSEASRPSKAQPQGPTDEKPARANNKRPDGPGRQRADPLRNVEWITANTLLVGLWCSLKGLKATELPKGHRMCRYRKRYTCLAIPAEASPGVIDSWLLYEIGGKLLPVFTKKSKEPAEWVKVKLLKAE